MNSFWVPRVFRTEMEWKKNSFHNSGFEKKSFSGFSVLSGSGVTFCERTSVRANDIECQSPFISFLATATYKIIKISRGEPRLHVWNSARAKSATSVKNAIFERRSLFLVTKFYIAFSVRWLIKSTSIPRTFRLCVDSVRELEKTKVQLELFFFSLGERTMLTCCAIVVIDCHAIFFNHLGIYLRDTKIYPGCLI